MAFPTTATPEEIAKENLVQSSIDWAKSLKESDFEETPNYARIDLASKAQNRPEPSGFGEEFGRAWDRGWDELKATGFALGGVAAQAMGADDFADGMYESMLDQQAMAQYNKGSVEGLKDIWDKPTIDRAARYAIGAIGENLPLFIPSLVTGGAGGIAAKAGSAAAKELMLEWTSKYGIQKATEMAAKRVAIKAAIGAASTSVPMEIGQIGMQNAEQSGGDFDPKTAIIGGTLAGSLDTALPGRIMGQVLGPRIRNRAIANTIERVAEQAPKGWTKTLATEAGKEFVKDFVLEAGTEGTQTIVENVASKLSSPDPFKWTEDDNWQVADAMIQGGLIGGGVGGLTGFYNGFKDKISNKSPQLNESNRPDVRNRESDLQEKVNDLIPEDEEGFDINSEDDQKAQIMAELDAINSQIEQQGETPDLIQQRDDLRQKLGVNQQIDTRTKKEIQRDLFQNLLENDNDIDAAYKKTGYKNVDGFWVHPHVDENWVSALKPETKEKLKEKGIKFFEPVQKGAAGQILKLSDGTRGVGVKTDRDIGESAFTNKDNTVLHEVGHHVWQDELSDEQKDKYKKGGLRTKHGKEVKEGTGRGSGYQSSIEGGVNSAEEEDFAQYYADNNGDLGATLGSGNDNTDEESNRIAGIQEEIAKVKNQIEKTGDPDRTLQARQKELEAALVKNPQGTEPTREIPPQKLGGRKRDLPLELDPERQEANANIDNDIDTIVSELDAGKTNPAEGEEIRSHIREAIRPHQDILAGTGTRIISRDKFVKKYGSNTLPGSAHRAAVHIDSNTGQISLVVPNPRSYVRKGANQDLIAKTFQHEAIHIAHLQALKDRHSKEAPNTNIGDFVNRENGKIYTSLKIADPAIDSKIQAAYPSKTPLSESQKAAEAVRMMIERMRTGTITEDVQALNMASRQEGGKGAATTAFQNFLKAIRDIRDAINRFIVNPTPAIKRILDETNKILDKYNAVLPQPKPENAVQEQSTAEVGVRREEAVGERVGQENQPEAASREGEEGRGIQAPLEPNQAQEQTQEVTANTFQSGDDWITTSSVKPGWMDRSGNFIQLPINKTHGELAGEIENVPAIEGSKALNKKGWVRIVPSGPDIYADFGEVQGTLTNSQRRALIKKAEASGSRNIITDGVNGFRIVWENYGSDNSTSPLVLQAAEDPIDHFERTGRASTQVYTDNLPLSKGTQSKIKEQERNLSKIAESVKGNNKPRFRESKMGVARNPAIPVSHLSEPRAPALREAADIILEHGLENVARSLITDPTGETLGIRPEEGGLLAAVHGLVFDGLQRAAAASTETVKGIEDARKLIGLNQSIKSVISTALRGGGRYIGMQQSLIKNFVGNDARTQLTYALLSRLPGLDPRMFSKVKEKISESSRLVKKKVITKTEFKKNIFSALLATNKEYAKNPEGFNQAVKETTANRLVKQSQNINALPEDVENALFMAADDIKSHEDKVADTVLGYIGQYISFGMPIGKRVTNPSNIVASAMSSVLKRSLKKAGIIGPEEKYIPLTRMDQIRYVISNPETWSEVVDALEKRSAEEAGTTPGSKEFGQYKKEFDNLRANPISNEEISRASSEIFSQLKLKLPSVVKKAFGEGIKDLERVKKEFRDGMEGITSPENLDKLAGRFNQIVNDRYEAALEKSFSLKENPAGKLTGTNLRDAMRKFNEIMPSHLTKDVASISDLVELSHSDLSDYSENLEDFLVKYLGLPNTKEFPIAKKMAATVRKSLNDLVAQEIREGQNKVIESAANDLEDVLPEKAKGSSRSIVEKAILAANSGLMDDRTVYEALRKTKPELGLPEYDENLANEIKRRGDIISRIPFDTPKMAELQKLDKLIRQNAQIPLMDAIISFGYFSQLSGIGTWGETNPLGNIFQMLAQTAVWQAQHPNNPLILKNLSFAFNNQARSEARMVMKEGISPSKAYKLMEKNVWEFSTPENNPFFHHFKMPARLLSRFLDATDTQFGRPQFWAYLAKSGYDFSDPEARNAAMTIAKQKIEELGIEDKSGELASVWASDYLMQEAGVSNEDKQRANLKGLMGAYMQPSQGFLGAIGNAINDFGSRNDVTAIAKYLTAPYTRVPINVLNEAINYTPWGLIRYLRSSGLMGEYLKKQADNWRLKDPSTNIDLGADKDLAAKAIIGTAVGMPLIALAMSIRGSGDDSWIDFYGDGTRLTPEQKKQLGFRPNTMRVGGVYFNTLLTPAALWFSWAGAIRDGERAGNLDDNLMSRISYVFPALISTILKQSTLSGLNDFYEAITSTDKFTKLERFFARSTVGTALNPAIVRDINRLIDPTLPDAVSLQEIIVSNTPFANLYMRPRLDYWGQPMKDDRYPGRRIFSFVRDPLLKYLGSRGIDLPGRGRPFNNGKMFTDEQLYEYNKLTGQNLRKAIDSEIGTIQSMSKDEAEEFIKDLDRQAKEDAKDSVLNGQ